MTGKRYLVDLTQSGYPLIPTIDQLEDLSTLGQPEKYIIKPIYGASSEGVEALIKSDLSRRNLDNYIIQPLLDFEYEISFYFIDSELIYALHAPNKTERWQLVPFAASIEDLEFARQFVNWNTLTYGIQRIDACRLKTGKLLLMEIEDHSPYLSLLDISPELKNLFLKRFLLSLQKHFK